MVERRTIKEYRLDRNGIHEALPHKRFYRVWHGRDIVADGFSDRYAALRWIKADVQSQLTGALWLFDSRDRFLTGKRILYVLPLTSEGKRQAWDIVLGAELVTNERLDYRGLVDADATDNEPNHTEVFNALWAEYGWFLMPLETDAEAPHDAQRHPLTDNR